MPGLDDDGIEVLESFMNSRSLEELVRELPVLKTNPGLLETVKIMDDLDDFGYGDLIEFRPSVIRGFDYYDGLVF